ncbi:unnamed protein product [Urochloa decumbens]|uniref:Uncharacterized protein n=1 Tax=Urochloa decumbens TaxID=240449 RepID=A0ABC9B0P9_9POAL
MKITVQSSKSIKPSYYSSGGSALSAAAAIPLTVFDKVNYDLYISGINFFRPPSPPNAVLAAGLARALAEYREWAGRLGFDAAGRRAILLNDTGARFVEATADAVSLDAVMPIKPSPAILKLHPSGGDGADNELPRPAAAGDLVSKPLAFAAELVSRAVARVDEGYFRSFVDFASSGAVEEEGLVPAADAAETVYSPDVEVDSLLHAPFCDMDFGGGPPFFFMPSYLPVEGSVFIVRSFAGDRSVDAYVPLFGRDMETFNRCCYSLEMVDARL